MGRVNVYLPDELVEEARAAGLNVSKLTREAVGRALAAGRTDHWLDEVLTLRPTGVSHSLVTAAVAEAKDELGARG